MKLLVDSSEFWQHFEMDVKAATRHVYLQTMSFEGDSVGLDVERLLKQAQAPDIRLIIDAYTTIILSDRFLYSPRNWFDKELQNEKRETHRIIQSLRARGIKVKVINPVGFLFHHLVGRNHKKLVLIDDRIAYIGGINFSEHNFAWHDLMIRIEADNIASFLKQDFLRTWERQNWKGIQEFESIHLYMFDGTYYPEAMAQIFDLFKGAKRQIVIQSPYVTFPYFEPFRDAVKRGVDVILIAPEKNNRGFLDRYTSWEASRAGILLKLYPQRMTHLKMILIDDSHLIIGSSNFDYLSIHSQQELLAVITDPEIIAAAKKRIIDKDLRLSREADTPPNQVDGKLRHFLLKILSSGSAFLNRNL